jgi:hypothetical protein
VLAHWLQSIDLRRRASLTQPDMAVYLAYRFGTLQTKNHFNVGSRQYGCRIIAIFEAKKGIAAYCLSFGRSSGFDGMTQSVAAI